MRIREYERGKPISEPGIYSGVPIDTYHSASLCDAPSISSGGLRKIFNESPAHYFAGSPYNPERDPPEPTAAMTLGRAAHHLLLGEDDFSTLFIMRPDLIAGEPWHGNRTVCKSWARAQAAAGRTVLTGEDIKSVRGMARSLAAHPMIQSGILNGLVEHSMVWKCKDTGVWKKARPDNIPNDSGDFADLKTTVSVLTPDLQRTLADFSYHQQGALIGEGFHNLTGNRDATFTLVFVEKKPPYCCRIVTLWNDDLLRGERQNYAAAAIFADCLGKNYWPGPGEDDDTEFMALPEWMAQRIETKLTKLEAQER